MAAMELVKNYPVSKFEADNALSDMTVINKYKAAADIVNAVFPQVLARVSPGVSVCDLCQYGDDLLTAYTAGCFKKLDRGIAMPTCVSVNNYVQYFSPLLDNDYHLKAGDVVKIEMGAHIDGYIATSAHTTVVNPTPSVPVNGPAADVVCAAYYALEAAKQMLRPGVKSSEITRVIGEIAAYYRCKPVEGTFSSSMKRFVLRAGKDIENAFKPDLVEEELEKTDFEIEANQVYQLNIVLTTGNGKTKFSDHKPTVFQRDVNKSYQLKMKSARAAYSNINEHHSVFPFASRALPSNQIRLGLTSLVEHGLINPFIPMRTYRPTDLVAQFKATVLTSPNGQLCTSLPLPLPYVHSQYCIPEQTTATQILSAPSVVEYVQPSQSLPEVNVVFGERRVVVEDTAMEMS